MDPYLAANNRETKDAPGIPRRACRCANSASDWSPFNAAIATCALPAVKRFRRFRRAISDAAEARQSASDPRRPEAIARRSFYVHCTEALQDGFCRCALTESFYPAPSLFESIPLRDDPRLDQISETLATRLEKPPLCAC